MLLDCCDPANDSLVFGSEIKRMRAKKASIGRQKKQLKTSPEDCFSVVASGIMPSPSDLAGAKVDDFAIGKYQVTFGDWICTSNWARDRGYVFDSIARGKGSTHPVTHVSWYDAVKFCNAKSEMDGLLAVYEIAGKIYKEGLFEPEVVSGANGYRLPTEVEWEWAARGSRLTRSFIYSGGNDLDAVGWYDDNAGLGVPSSKRGTRPVGQKQPNELGIYDMSGNVNEWCFESVIGVNSNRRVRGGSWGDKADQCAVSGLCKTFDGKRFITLRGGYGYQAHTGLGGLGFRFARNQSPNESR